MKVFLWLLTLAFILVCLTGWMMSEVIEHSMRDMPLAAGFKVPAFTRLIILPHGWLLFVPLPWVIYAGVLSFRHEVTPEAALLFAGTLVLVAVLLVCVLVIALTLPHLPIHA
jgi:hypothetical protein